MSNSPEHGRELYGEAIVPGPFFESEWSDGSGFELLDFLADRSLCEQAIAIIRRV